jgi:preprotein translocase subunit SecG
MAKNFDKRIVIVVLGIIILLTIATSWSAELAYVQERLISGANVERGAQVKDTINARYTIWFVTVIFISSLLVYITSPKRY